MEKHLSRVLWTLAVLLLVSASLGKDHNTRMTEKEREEAFANMKKRYSNRDDPFCIPDQNPPPNPPPIPTAPKSFTTNVEIAYEEKKMKVIYGAESFDGVLNTGIMRYELMEGIILGRPSDREEVIRYSIPLDEALFIITNEECEDEGGENCDPRKNCRVGNLEDLSAEMKELFGFGDVNGDSGYFGAGGILQWGPQYDYVYKGNSDCRGMNCEKYETCITLDDEKAMALITYYWSAKDWNVTTNGVQVPVAIEVYASGKFGHIFNREVMQRYDFYDFERDMRPDPDELVPPVDVYCKGRKNQYDPPRVPHFFAYNAESIIGFDLFFPDGDNQTTPVSFTLTTTHSQYYDWDAKVVSTEYIPWFIFGEENRFEYTTMLYQDFEQGLSYEILKHQKVCNIRPIENATNAGDIIIGDDGSVTMLPPWIFVDLDEPMQFNGVHWTRGVSADVWIGRKRHLLILENYVWYYASAFMNDESENMRSAAAEEAAEQTPKSPKKKPSLRLKMNLPEEFKDTPPEFVSMDKSPIRFEKYLEIVEQYPHSIYNIYNYQTDPPMTHTLDVSLCYEKSQMRHFIFDLPDDTLKKVRHFRDRLKYAAQASLAEVGIVSPLRINRLVLEEREGSPLRMLFTVLDKAKVVGTSPGAGLENNLNDAVSRISSFISQSQMVIVVHLPGISLHPEEPIYAHIVPSAGSLKEVTRDDFNNYQYETKQQYAPGDMAGLAIGMLLLGGLIGVAVNMVLQRRAAGQTGLPRINSAMKSRPTPETAINLNADMTASDS